MAIVTNEQGMVPYTPPKVASYIFVAAVVLSVSYTLLIEQICPSVSCTAITVWTDSIVPYGWINAPQFSRISFVVSKFSIESLNYVRHLVYIQIETLLFLIFIFLMFWSEFSKSITLFFKDSDKAKRKRARYKCILFFVCTTLISLGVFYTIPWLGRGYESHTYNRLGFMLFVRGLAAPFAAYLFVNMLVVIANLIERGSNGRA